MQRLRPRHIPPLRDDGPDSGHTILSDGTTALLRIAQPGDADELQRFVERLSPAATRHRFFSESAPPAEVIRTLCDSSQPQRSLTLLALRRQDDTLSIIASGSYHARNPHEAEVAMAVDDRLHGHGLGTILLERLALLAVRHGFTKLWAITHADNLAMREVFATSGFTMEEHLEGGDMEVELSLTPTDHSVRQSEWRERVATTASLRPLFHPRAVAVIGASRSPQSIGYRLLDALQSNGFRGRCYAVNPHASTIAGVDAFPSLHALPEPADLAVIAVPKDAVLSVVDDCAATGVRALVVITAGFAEVGEEGRRLQAQLLDKVRQHGMRMVGPNCFGILNTDPSVRLNATFTSTFPLAGSIAMSSQSGALGLALLAASRRLQLGLSTFVSVGNKADVSVNDLLQYWESDHATTVILLYVESFGNPRRFAHIARRVSRNKPIVALKAGRTSSGKRAASSHTAALAANDVAVDALFQQTGILRANTLEDMFALAAALSEQPLPKGKRVGILTNAGGPAILCADACEAAGLEVPELSQATITRLSPFLPASASLRNPVDLIASASPEQYGQAIDTLLTSDDIDALIILYIAVTSADVDPIAEGITRGIAAARAAQPIKKPVYVGWMVESDRERRLSLPGETIPTFGLPELPARVLGTIVGYVQWRDRPLGMVPDFDDLDLPAVHTICRDVLATRGGGWLTVAETRAVLSAMAITLPPGGVATSAEEAAALAAQIGFPVAVKLASHTLVHKTEIGGVHLNLTGKAEVRRAYDDIAARLSQEQHTNAMEGVLVQPMVKGGVEVMAGMVQDPSFGPLIGFGLGGIHVEILGDVRFRITPLTELDAADLIRSIKGYRLLQGYRGHPPADVDAIQDLLLRLSRLVEEVPEIVELDLNPIFALAPGEGYSIVDARIRVAGK
ncbi:GNAT family N-acetyltransferase [Nitrospira defluvii]|uniref:GNAT family N-acetyltransferase n=1 Tax=Nitrospira defluvii TaxID=330214 RepID=A0ABN7LN94_9BACT|nr:GNAT family N-acetyltransferase [Nitrospira defluvii]CAE6760253.1 GNAT family N-acetyltransferase [Nitrospira defluvii]